MDYGNGVAFEIYGASHPLYQQANTKHRVREFTEDLLNLSDEDGLETFPKIVGQYLIKDWRGVTDEDGEELPCNCDNFVDMVLCVDGLLNLVVGQSYDIQNKHAQQVETTKKKPSKGGNTKG
ncbi:MULTISPECIES: hypothetical protein [unclassified Moraxella]|uniref:hypothetical protein n=1 Tax=unclassified Moraxella TaxID=2685852 RepID=UPI002B40CB43|nr:MULTISPECIES: hypothetical protein [unclassified Moraxella]